MKNLQKSRSFAQFTFYTSHMNYFELFSEVRNFYFRPSSIFFCRNYGFDCVKLAPSENPDK